ncbi:chemotaxis protein CheB [Adhaeribacter rhizoryzae]|uniref:PAS domain-containing protein n=1 Tax=Adhaeribacter rhizoryzae TaxID=2607907 RepID=A0A5M6D6J6_9BACT|nr:chemotaxis protein CheB [Adhaeribacter rhizoryzae]KAA5540815.1 PAS domain-containing protein [Adhaeribacter rhizoryzae]
MPLPNDIQHTSANPAPLKAKADHYLIGIGASAGGLEAIHTLFDHFPSNSSFSFVIVQHLSPDHKSLMAELLSKHTRMQVQEAEDNMPTRPNCIYVLPSGKQLTLKKGRLRLVEKQRSREPNFAIDIFFESLAKDRGRSAIGIILSGTGTDGTKGSLAIKTAGGMVVVQDPHTAKFDGMPRSAIEAGSADFILAPDLMAHEILEYARQIPLVKSLVEMPEEQRKQQVLHEILDLICTHTKTDFKDYKEATVYRRINKRMGEVEVKTLEEYLQYLHVNPAEIKKLCQEILIGVTKFFRDPEAFEILKNDILPRIIASKTTEESIKVWVTACSTGEEAYSLAMLFQECCAEASRESQVKIFATDIDQRALDKASKGIYSSSIEKDVSAERLEKFFYPKGNKYVINAEVRKMVVFAKHDLQKDPPYSKLDLISCRNMLIYLNPALQNKVMATFPYALNLNGYLFLGPSEQLGDIKMLFYEENRKWRIYRKIKESTRPQPNYGYGNYNPTFGVSNGLPVKNTQISQFNDFFMDAVAETYKITALYVDENYQLLHGIGDIERFLKFPNKRLQFNLLKVVPKELAVILSVDIRKVLQHHQEVESRQVVIKLNEKNQLVQITIKPVDAGKNQPRVILILLQEIIQSITPFVLSETLQMPETDFYRQLTALELELKDAHESLHLTVQDLSTANEELQSVNEELMSSNEELQSSNEEMQSLNEELHTVNSEHQLKIKELQELNEDLDNYIRSSNIAQLYLDHDLVIRKFTPSVKEIINIIESDLGRPIHHLSHNLQYADFLENIKHVNRYSLELEQEVETTTGKYFLIKIIPYLKQDGNKDGVVVSFVDVTTLTTLSNVVQGVLNSSFNNIMALSAIRNEQNKIIDFNWILLNKKAEELIGKPQAQLLNSSALTELPFLKKSGLFRKFVDVVETGKHLLTEQHLEVNDRKDWFEISGAKVGDGLTVTMAEITQKKLSEEKILLAYEELKKAEGELIKLNNKLEERVAERTQQLTASEERFRLVSMATNDVVWDWDLVSNEIWWSETIEAMLGYPASQMEEGIDGWFNKVHPEDKDSIKKGINQAINRGKDQWMDEYRIMKADGTYAYVFNRAYILHNEYKIPYRVLGSFIDLTDLKQAQQKLQNTNEHLVRVIEDLDMFVYTASHDLKSPMANVEGLVLLLEEEINSSEEITEESTRPIFTMIKESINSFKTVINDLTDIAKVQRDVDGEAELVNLNEILEQVRGNIQDLIAGVPVQFNINFGVTQLNFSRKNLYSIFYNLISNAVKYRSSERDPEITLSTERQGPYLVLSVADNGLGLSQENVSKLFALFRRFHSHVSGTGMGLYIVKRMMDNAGGKIDVQSEEGQGTTFILYFLES